MPEPCQHCGIVIPPRPAAEDWKADTPERLGRMLAYLGAKYGDEAAQDFAAARA